MCVYQKIKIELKYGYIIFSNWIKSSGWKGLTEKYGVIKPLFHQNIFYMKNTTPHILYIFWHISSRIEYYKLMLMVRKFTSISLYNITSNKITNIKYVYCVSSRYKQNCIQILKLFNFFDSQSHCKNKNNRPKNIQAAQFKINQLVPP